MWTSGMAVDCEGNFAWCSTNAKIDLQANDWKTDAKSQKCLALKVNHNVTNVTPAKERKNCTEKLFFACEVIL